MPNHKLLACETFRHEMAPILRSLPAAMRPDADWLPMGLHERPDLLHDRLQAGIDRAGEKGYDVVLLLFGLCGGATDGLRAPAGRRLVIPRVHDCITLFLGSMHSREREQAAEPGTFWFTRSVLRKRDGEAADIRALGAATFGLGGGSAPRDRDGIRQAYTEQYGEAAADYLMKTLVDGWRANYTRAVFLDGEPYPEREEDAGRLAAFAAENGWRYERRAVDTRLLRALLTGPWPEEEFVVTPPGGTLSVTSQA